MDKVSRTILTTVRDKAGKKTITRNTKFQETLGMDSLDMMDLLMDIEQTLKVDNADLVFRVQDCKTVGNLIQLVKNYYHITDGKTK